MLIVDEAQNLDPSVLETIRLLSNFETSQSKLLQILLVGQPQLARKLASSSLEQLQQRISMFAKVEPFSADETARYIAHRLKVAGYTGGELFTSGAMEIIKDRSKGVPRNINRLCFSALSLGCAMGRKRIDAEMMREVVADLHVESHERESQNNQLALVPRVSSRGGNGRFSCHLLSRGIQQPASTMGSGRRRPGSIDSNRCGIALLFPWQDRRFLPENRSVYHHPRILRRPFKVLRRPSPLPSRFLSKRERTVPTPPAMPAHLPTGPRHSGPAGRRRKNRKSCGAARRNSATDSTPHPGTRRQPNPQTDSKAQPRITNPDHIETDQEIRLPQISKASNPPPVAGANDLSRKN